MSLWISSACVLANEDTWESSENWTDRVARCPRGARVLGHWYAGSELEIHSTDGESRQSIGESPRTRMNAALRSSGVGSKGGEAQNSRGPE